MKKSKSTSKNWAFDKHPNGSAFSNFMVGEMIRVYHPDGTYPTKIMKVGRTKGVVIESRKYRKGKIISISRNRSCFLGVV